MLSLANSGFSDHVSNNRYAIAAKIIHVENNFIDFLPTKTFVESQSVRIGFDVCSGCLAVCKLKTVLDKQRPKTLALMGW